MAEENANRQLFSRVLLVSCAVVVAGACGDTNLTSTDLAPVDPLPGQHTPHTDIQQGVWPPQPLGMSDEQALPASARESAQANVVNAARSIVMNNPVIRQALGDEFIEFDGSLGDSKGEVTATFIFFSYSANQTVEVALHRSGGVEYNAIAASKFQPTEHADEVQRAIALADAALVNAGFETAGLAGTAMLAFPRASEDTDRGLQFYPQRVLYVTFGEGGGELPAYSALANLSTGVVSEEGLIQ